MKKGLLIILPLGLLTTAANAGNLSLRFAGGGTSIALVPGDTATIEVVFAMNRLDTSNARLTGAELRFDVGSLAPGFYGDFVLDDPNARFTVTSISTAITSWNTDATILGPFNREGFLAFAMDPAGTSGIVGDRTDQASVVIMSFDVTQSAMGINDTYIVFYQEDTALTSSPLARLYNGTNLWYNTFGWGQLSGDQQFLYGTGNPGYADPRFIYHGYETLSPIVIHSMCLLDSHCDDGNPCTTDLCQAGICVNEDNTDPCEDGVFCNGAEQCLNGECVGGGDPCTAPGLVCDEVNDECDCVGNEDCNTNGSPDSCDIRNATSIDCNGNGVPDECETPWPTATVIAAVSRKSCDLNLNLAATITSDPRQGGITQLRIEFDVPLIPPGPIPVQIQQRTCALSGSYATYLGDSNMIASVDGNNLVVNFSPGLENARTYRLNLGCGVTSIPGQCVEIRGLAADVNSDGEVNAIDRSVVVGYWTGPGFSCATDLDASGTTNATDRSIVVGVWTGMENCAP